MRTGLTATTRGVLGEGGVLGLYPNVLSAPLAVLFELTSECNLRCLHCFANSGLEGSDQLSLEEWTSLADQLADLNVPLVFLSGGEPLLFPHLREIASHLKARGFYVCLLSNLTLMHDRLAGFLADIGVNKIEGNLDGPTAEIYDRFRGVSGSFARTLEGILACTRRNLSLRLNVTLSRLNVNCLEEIVCLALDLGVHDLAFLPLIRAGRANDNFDNLSLSFGEYVSETRPKLKEMAAAYQGKARLLFEGDPELMAWGDPAGVLPACGAGRIHCTITPRGFVTPDVYFADTDPVAIAGNIRKTRFTEIWCESPVFRAMRRMPGGLCSDCSERNCAGGDLYTAYQWHGSLMAGPDPRCHRLEQEEAR